MRQRVVEAVMAYTVSRDDPAKALAAAAYHQLNALHGLLLAKPDCALARARQQALLVIHPNHQAPARPDLLHGDSNSGGLLEPSSPWSKAQLLAKEPSDCLDAVLAFQTKGFDGPFREDGLAVLREAVAEQPVWGIALGQALAGRAVAQPELWCTDLWSALLDALASSTQADATVWRSALAWAEHAALQREQAPALTRWLLSLVNNGGKPFALDLLDDANRLAWALWPQLPAAEPVEDEHQSWLSEAINRPAGHLMLFWLNGLSLRMQGRVGVDRTLPEYYRERFEAALALNSRNGGLARCVLAGYVGFLFGLSPQWTQEHLVPLFSDPIDAGFHQAWDGFLTWGRLRPGLAEALLPAYKAALPRFLQPARGTQREKFVKRYTDFLLRHHSTEREALIALLLQKGKPQDHLAFARCIQGLLARGTAAANDRRWADWLQAYWDRRLVGLPTPLQPAEVGAMTDWLPYLSGAYPEAVACLCRSPQPEMQHCGLLFALRASDNTLPDLHADPTADLLVFLSPCVPVHERWLLREVARRLKGLTPQKQAALEAALRAVGV